LKRTDSILNSGLFSLPTASLDGFSAPATRSACASAERPDAFVVGDENALVRVLAAAVMGNEPVYSPIVLWGPQGVGKSCLGHALAARRQQALGLKHVIATTGADLFQGLAQALETDAVEEFRSRLHACDLLFVDDLHRLANKPAAQQFFLTTLDALMRRDALVVVTLRRPPLATKGLKRQIASRLSSGLIVRLSPPGYEARYAIVRQAAARHAVRLTDQDVARLAHGRGGLSERVLTADKLRHAVLERAAGISLEDESTPSNRTSDGCKSICRIAAAIVARHYGVAPADLKRPTRRKTVAAARALAMYLVRALASPSYSAIGEHFGGRDHSTVMHACRKLTAAVEQDLSLRRRVDDLAVQIAAECDL
jgi:chromosomal replication initiator protein